MFGLGYVGTVSAGCLAFDGHEVVGVDPVPTKVDLINRGQSPIVETDVGEMLAATIKFGRLRATSDPSQYLPNGMPTIVRTSLIGHSFLDAYEPAIPKVWISL